MGNNDNTIKFKRSGSNVLDTEIKSTSIDKRYHPPNNNLISGSFSNVNNQNYEKIYNNNRVVVTKSSNHNLSHNTPTNTVYNNRTQTYSFAPQKLSLKSRNPTK